MLSSLKAGAMSKSLPISLTWHVLGTYNPLLVGSEPLSVLYFGLGVPQLFVVTINTLALPSPFLPHSAASHRRGPPFPLIKTHHLQVDLTWCSQIIFDVGTKTLSPQPSQANASESNLKASS